MGGISNVGLPADVEAWRQRVIWLRPGWAGACFYTNLLKWRPGGALIEAAWAETVSCVYPSQQTWSWTRGGSSTLLRFNLRPCLMMFGEGPLLGFMLQPCMVTLVRVPYLGFCYSRAWIWFPKSRCGG
eukprot:1160610-Pelagomonas_calceolata.AAC.15